MKAFISILMGIISLVFIAGLQLALISIQSISVSINSSSTLHYNALPEKLIVILLAAIGLTFSYLYLKSSEKKFKSVNRLGMSMSVLAILLCLIPLHLI